MAYRGDNEIFKNNNKFAGRQINAEGSRQDSATREVAVPNKQPRAKQHPNDTPRKEATAPTTASADQVSPVNGNDSIQTRETVMASPQMPSRPTTRPPDPAVNDLEMTQATAGQNRPQLGHPFTRSQGPAPEIPWIRQSRI